MTSEKHIADVRKVLAEGGPLPEGTRIEFGHPTDPIQQVTTRDLAAEEKATADAEKAATDAAKKTAAA